MKSNKCFLLLFSLLIAMPIISSAKPKIEPASGVVFGSFNLCCRGIQWADYRLRIKRVGDKKSIVLSAAHGAMYEDYTFKQKLPAGKYYFYKFSAPEVDYENTVFTEESAFEVVEGKVVYLGDWHFDLLTNSTSFSVKYDENRIKSFFEKNAQYSIDDLLIGVHGKSSFSLNQSSAKEKQGSLDK